MRSATLFVVFPLVYALSVVAGRATRLGGGEVALLWPAAAVGVIWLLSARQCGRWERVMNIALLAGVAFATNLATGASTPLSLWFVLVNVVLSVVTVEILALGRGKVALRDPADFARLVVAVAAGTCSAAVLATGYFTLVLDAPVWETFGLFAVRNGATALLGLSIWLSLRNEPTRPRRYNLASAGEALLVGSGLAAVFFWTFWLNAGLPIAFISLVPAMWVALRYTTTVSTVFLLIAGAWIVYATLSNRGFVADDVQTRALLAQGMVCSLTLVVLTLSLYRDSRARLIAQLEQARDRADHLATHDSLTGLANRALFTERVEHALAQVREGVSGGVGLIFLDLDGFKAVNDTWGHAEGDEVLLEVSARVEAAIEPTDTAARLGGDEFAVLCPATFDIERLEVIAQQLRVDLRRPITLSTGDTYDRLSVSVGVVTEHAWCDAETLLRRADTLMYHAKRSGKDCVSIDPSSGRGFQPRTMAPSRPDVPRS
ncbi:diguanylate cyclase domain-containing protein [Mycobacterium sp. pW049]|uniref:diguanylate cyclase domain-containing protein n=1 Tax=[Mycobacterium] bulgaricum TaxID=3238985 RepID=UPI00351AC2CA